MDMSLDKPESILLVDNESTEIVSQGETQVPATTGET